MTRRIRATYSRIVDALLPSVSASAERCENVPCIHGDGVPQEYNCHCIDTGTKVVCGAGRC